MIRYLYPLLIPMVVVLVTASFTTTNDPRESALTVKGRSQSRIILNWSPVEEQVSHYIIERSINGRAFYEAGIVFTGELSTENDYFFTDDLRMNYGGPLYYRLRLVKMDKSEKLTPVTTVSRMGGVNPVTH